MGGYARPMVGLTSVSYPKQQERTVGSIKQPKFDTVSKRDKQSTANYNPYKDMHYKDPISFGNEQLPIYPTGSSKVTLPPNFNTISNQKAKVYPHIQNPGFVDYTSVQDNTGLSMYNPYKNMYKPNPISYGEDIEATYTPFEGSVPNLNFNKQDLVPVSTPKVLPNKSPYKWSSGTARNTVFNQYVPSQGVNMQEPGYNSTIQPDNTGNAGYNPYEHMYKPDPISFGYKDGGNYRDNWEGYLTDDEIEQLKQGGAIIEYLDEE
jgi:hypothetical protein